MNPASKALMRSRMKEASLKRAKRIESPLVQYNDVGQPSCKVCNITIKSESLWTVHIASRQHKDAVEDMKAHAKALGVSSTKPSATSVLPIAAPPVQTSHTTSTLPADFFDSPIAKRPRTVPHSPSEGLEENRSNTDSSRSQQDEETKNSNRDVLPEGFFDSVDADHRARGLEPPRVDIQEELKEFQKAIQSDMKELESRLEEEEYEAAEEREAREQIEQRSLLERIQNLQKQQKKIAVAAMSKKANFSTSQELGLELSSDDDDNDEDNLLVDWRAKHL